MKKTALILTAALALLAGTAMPSYADGPLGDVGSLMGSVSATIVGAPEGVLYYSLWRCPLKTTQYLAEKFGDSKGFQQNVAGAVLGIPTGFCGAFLTEQSVGQAMVCGQVGKSRLARIPLL